MNPNAAITSVTGGTSPLCAGSTTTVTANGVVLGGGTGGWSSSVPAVATVNASGVVTAVGAGATNIIYTITGGCGGTKSAFQSITVQGPITVARCMKTDVTCNGTSTGSIILGTVKAEVVEVIPLAGRGRVDIQEADQGFQVFCRRNL